VLILRSYAQSTAGLAKTPTEQQLKNLLSSLSRTLNATKRVFQPTLSKRAAQTFPSEETLLKYLRPHENAWQFEEFGSIRAERLKPIFLGVDRKWVKHSQFEIIPYIFTGISQGRWYEPVVELFRKHNIVVNFSIRGFVNEAPRRSIKNKIKYQIKRLPVLIIHWINLFN
jgi:hypothetical protein